MALRIELKPFEELFISHSVITNGPSRIAFAVSGTSPLVRGRDYLRREDVDTICRELQFAIQALYLEGADGATALSKVEPLAGEILKRLPVLSPHISEVVAQVDAGDLFKALKASRTLVAREGEIHSLVSAEAL